MNYNMMHEAAAAVAANHRMDRRDVMDIIRFAALTMLALTAVVAMM